MHTVELLESAIGVAQRLGYRVRLEWLDGSGGGGCLLKGQKWIFLDLAQSPNEQFDQVIEAMRTDPGLAGIELPSDLRPYLDVRRTA
ncbi:MAG: hypothetical protein ACC645_16015 [Pirellulales bacterium]